MVKLIIQIILFVKGMIFLEKSKQGPAGKSAYTVKVGEKGQIVIPKELREIFGIHAGDSLIILADQKKGIAIPPKGMFDFFYRQIFEANE